MYPSTYYGREPESGEGVRDKSTGHSSGGREDQMITTSISGGREDAAHAVKDEAFRRMAQRNAELSRMYEAEKAERQKVSQYAAALFRDHDRERKALYEIEQASLAAHAKFRQHMKGPSSFTYIAQHARRAIRSYEPNSKGGAG